MVGAGVSAGMAGLLFGLAYGGTHLGFILLSRRKTRASRLSEAVTRRALAVAGSVKE